MGDYPASADTVHNNAPQWPPVGSQTPTDPATLKAKATLASVATASRSSQATTQQQQVKFYLKIYQ